MIYYIKKVPDVIKSWFILNFPPENGFTYRFYTYKKSKLLPMEGSNKIYGCFVDKNDKLWHYATQADFDWFVENKQLKLY
jgi:hypothetical protein